jgi:hypothetical protein
MQVKSAEQQGQLMQHRTRDVLIRQRTQIINADTSPLVTPALAGELDLLLRLGTPVSSTGLLHGT